MILFHFYHVLYVYWLFDNVILLSTQLSGSRGYERNVSGIYISAGMWNVSRGKILIWCIENLYMYVKKKNYATFNKSILRIFNIFIKFFFVNSLSIIDCSITIDRVYISSRIEQYYKISALLLLMFCGFFFMFLYLTYYNKAFSMFDFLCM